MKYVRTDLYMKLHIELGRLWVTPTIVFSVFNRILGRGKTAVTEIRVQNQGW